MAGDGGGDWFADESFWERIYELIFSEAGFAEAAGNVSKIAALAGVTGGAVLDLACGPGRYAIPLAAAGYRVTAVDRSRFLLDRGRQQARAAGASVEWIEADMRAFARPGTFDLAINMFTSFGYFDDPAENALVLENVLASLRPGGALVLDHIGKELLAAKFQPSRAAELPGGVLLVNQTKIARDWSRIDDQWLLIEGNQVSRYRIGHWLYSGQEMRELFERVGFRDVKLYGTFDGGQYAPGAQRLIAIGKKPG